MPIEFGISIDLDLVLSQWWGDVTTAEWQDSFARYTNDANYRPGRTKLNDLSRVENVDAGFTALWSVLNRANAHARGHGVRTRIHLIAPQETVFGLARIFKTLSENTDGIVVEIHRTPARALAALGLGYGSVDELLEAGNFLPPMPARQVRDGT